MISFTPCSTWRRRAFVRISIIFIPGVSSIKRGASASSPIASESLVKSSSVSLPVFSFQASISACDTNNRSTNSSLLISREKIPVGIFSLTVTCCAILRIIAVFPVPGRAAKMIRFASCIPASLLSSSTNPVGTPLSPPARLCSSSKRSNEAASASLIGMKSRLMADWEIAKISDSASSTIELAAPSSRKAISVIFAAASTNRRFVAFSEIILAYCSACALVGTTFTKSDT